MSLQTYIVATPHSPCPIPRRFSSPLLAPDRKTVQFHCGCGFTSKCTFFFIFGGLPFYSSRPPKVSDSGGQRFKAVFNCCNRWPTVVKTAGTSLLIFPGLELVCFLCIPNTPHRIKKERARWGGSYIYTLSQTDTAHCFRTQSV